MVGVYVFIVFNAFSQNEKLRKNIANIVDDKRATVGVALISDRDTLTFNNDIPYPTMSVYKFHLALAVLDYMDKNSVPLSQTIHIQQSDLLPNTYSPLRDAYPDGDISLPISEILNYTVSKSDNNGCDILFRYLGGTEVVDKYIRGLGFSDFAIGATEEQMHSNWTAQYANWSTPLTMALLLEKFRTGSILSLAHHDFLWDVMVRTTTGTNKIKGLLPEGTIVAHKTGSSFRNAEGLNAADNDAGIIQLPDGRQYSFVVFVMDSFESDAVNAKIIADISKAVYDYQMALEL